MGDGLWGFSEVPRPMPVRYPTEALSGLSDLALAIQRRQDLSGQQAFARERLQEAQRSHRAREENRRTDLALRAAALRRAAAQQAAGQSDAQLQQEAQLGGTFGHGLPDEWHGEEPSAQPLPPPPRPMPPGMEPQPLGSQQQAVTPRAAAAVPAMPIAAMRMSAPPPRQLPQIPATPPPRPEPAAAPSGPAPVGPDLATRREARIRALVKEAKMTGQRLDANELRAKLKEEGLGL